jgi:hypothetical protein
MVSFKLTITWPLTLKNEQKVEECDATEAK